MCVCVCILYIHCIFIPSSVTGQLGCFHVLVVVNSAAVNIGIHVSFQINGFLWIRAKVWNWWKISSNILQTSFPSGSDGKESACSAGDPGLIPGSGRSPGEGNGYPIPRIEEPGRLQFMGSHRVEHDWVTNILQIFYVDTLALSEFFNVCIVFHRMVYSFFFFFLIVPHSQGILVPK